MGELPGANIERRRNVVQCWATNLVPKGAGRTATWSAIVPAYTLVAMPICETRNYTATAYAAAPA